MKKHDLIEFAEKAKESLKDFQSATVNAIHYGLFGEGERRRMLVADEVGLGKTIVAKGLIARVVGEHLASRRRKPFRVTYICSNQVIAHENLRKLNFLPQSIKVEEPISRIIDLAWDPEVESNNGEVTSPLLLNTLTPATSFKPAFSAGVIRERAIIYALLCKNPTLRNRTNSLQWILRCTVTDEGMPRMRKEFEWTRTWRFRRDLDKNLVTRLRAKGLDRKVWRTLYAALGVGEETTITLFQALLRLSRTVDGRNFHKYRSHCYGIAWAIRQELIHCCVEYVDADLYILDEFQRFRDLIDPDCEDDQSLIARRLFSNPKTRLLLLSATPFKAFTADDDLEKGEDHFRDFSKVLRFLLEGEDEALTEYEENRKALYRQILSLKSDNPELSPVHRNAVQDILRRVICRTERNQVAIDPTALIQDTWKDQPDHFSPGDITNFVEIDQIAKALEKHGIPMGSPIEFAKSALCPLSFMDRYQMKEVLKRERNDPKIQAALSQARTAWLRLDKFQHYEWQLDGSASANTPSNSRLSHLQKIALGDKGSLLLWVPPSLPYYPMEGPFKETKNFTKTLVFSSWIMVPRMISTLLSYEVERQTVGDSRTHDRDSRTIERDETPDRTYFTAEKKRRSPAPQLRFARQTESEASTPAKNMSNFTLLYPSRFLMEVIRPEENLDKGKSLAEMKRIAAEKIEKAIHEANLKQFSGRGGEANRWYWAAGMLLDRAHPKMREVVSEWFTNDDAWEGRKRFASKDHESTVKAEHFSYLRRCFEDPLQAELGEIPSNLPEVLADLAFGSPAVASLRGFVRLFPQEEKAARMIAAFRAADSKITLFNKPESIAAVRLAYHGTPAQKFPYWRMVARYCGDGCLQAVLEEYFHLLKGQNVDTEGAINQLLAAINITASSINVDGLHTFRTERPKKMRCHYAVEFGSQRIETDEGRHRAASIREVFNSPFRPFVLATTSIGQEGLDFHSYCRRIVHWNLPSNPVDLEQREGRINRFKGLVIRQNLAQRYGTSLIRAGANLTEDIWQKLFDYADQKERLEKGQCELIPFWHVESDGVKIERVVPMYPFSRDQAKLEQILRTLAVYRLAFGQPRQAELVEHVLKNNLSAEEEQRVRENLIINLSPIRDTTHL